MDCRKFYKNLEDYLDDGLDFPGRFGMERHAQQCIGCGKVMSDAQRLRTMARELERVKAPANFESRVLAEIAEDKTLGRFSAFRRFWIYGFDFPSARKLAFASSMLAVLAVSILYLYPLLSRSDPAIPVPASTPAAVTREPLKVEQNRKLPPVAETASIDRPSRPATADVSEGSKVEDALAQPSPELEQMVDREVGETDYVEFQMPGPDNRPVSIRWPDKTRMRYGQTDEEYFIRNVSH